LVPIMRQIYPIHNFPPYVSKIHSNIILPLRLGLPSGLLPSGFPTEVLCKFLIYLMRATCLTYLIYLDLINPIFSEAYKLWCSSFCSLLQSPATSSILGPDILLSTCSQTPLICVLPLALETKFHTCVKRVKLCFYMF
jgi:hypothetical protein